MSYSGAAHLEKPGPCTRVDGLPDGAQHAQGAAVVRGHELVVLRLQRPDQRRRRVELPHLHARATRVLKVILEVHLPASLYAWQSYT